MTNDPTINEALAELSKEQLAELVELYSKNLIALDGTWFQSVERERGMDEAMRRDREAWERFTVSEARRIKRFLGLSERPGLDGLEQALRYKVNTLSSVAEAVREGNVLVYRVVACRVQEARLRKGMPLHPCKSVGLVEYEGFARTIDDRLTCECLLCHPDVTDDACSCAWRFAIGDEGALGDASEGDGVRTGMWEEEGVRGGKESAAGSEEGRPGRDAPRRGSGEARS